MKLHPYLLIPNITPDWHMETIEFLGCAAILAAAQPLNPVIVVVVEISGNFKKF